MNKKNSADWFKLGEQYFPYYLTISLYPEYPHQRTRVSCNEDNMRQEKKYRKRSIMYFKKVQKNDSRYPESLFKIAYILLTAFPKDVARGLKAEKYLLKAISLGYYEALFTLVAYYDVYNIRPELASKYNKMSVEKGYADMLSYKSINERTEKDNKELLGCCNE